MEHANWPFKFRRPEDIVLPDIDKEIPDSIEEDEPMEKYLMDRRCVSSSGLALNLKSPWDFIAGWGQPDDGDEEKDHFRFGRAMHTLFLEPKKFNQLYVVEPEFTGLTKDGRESKQSADARAKKKEWRDSLPANVTFVTHEEIQMMTMMADSIMGHQQARNFFSVGKPEVSIRFTDPEHNVRIRIRPDFITDTGQDYYFFDLKSTRAETKEQFDIECAKYKYDIKMATYYDGLTKVYKREPTGSALIGLSKVYPHPVFVSWVGDEELDVGRSWYKESLKNLRRSILTGDWPMPQVQGQMMRMPTWRKTEALPTFDWKDGL